MKKLLPLFLVLMLVLASCMSAYAQEAPSTWYELSEDETVLTVRLPANTADGFKWDFEISDPDAFEFVTMEYVEDEAIKENTWAASFKSTFSKAGKVDLTLNYLRDGEEKPVETRVVKVFIVENGQLEILSAEALSDEQPTWYELSEDETVLTVRLPANTADGFKWDFEISDPDAFELITMEYAENDAGEGQEGADSTWMASFKSTSARGGSVDLTLRYLRSGEEAVETRLVKVYIEEKDQLDIISAKVN